MQVNQGSSTTAWPFDINLTSCIRVYNMLLQCPGRQSHMRPQRPQHYLHHRSPFFLWEGEFREELIDWKKRRVDLEAEASALHYWGLMNVFVRNFSKKYLVKGIHFYSRWQRLQHLLWFWASFVKASVSTIMTIQPELCNSSWLWIRNFTEHANQKQYFSWT